MNTFIVHSIVLSLANIHSTLSTLFHLFHSIRATI